MSSADQDTRIRIMEATARLLEEHQGKGVRMSDVAREAGLSRQAVYLHFGNRANLLVETARYGDMVHRGPERIRAYQEAPNAVARLDALIEFWGNYVPDILGLARALRAARETDEAAAAAWDDRMGTVYSLCARVIADLESEGLLAPAWTPGAATDVLWAMLSISTWELLTIERGWSIAEYVTRTQLLARRAFVTDTAGTPAVTTSPATRLSFT